MKPTILSRMMALLRPQRIDSPAPIYVRVAGMAVSEQSAMQFAAVWACVRIISETIATLGWHIVREKGDGAREREVNTDRDRILNALANPEMTAFSWREVALTHCLLWGNHYSEIQRDGGGRPKGLYPIDPGRVQVMRDADGALIYVVNGGTEGQETIAARDMLHVHGIGYDGVVGQSVVSHARQSIGSGLAMDQFGGKFYENGAHVGLVLKHPGKLSQNAHETLKASLADKFAGSKNAFQTMILEEGMTPEKLSMTMIDAQFLESRKFQVSEICRWFRVPPHKVADLDRATFSNIEHQSIEFVQDTILPWCRRLEQEIDAKLFGRWEATTRLNIDTLLRGDIVARYTAYDKGRLGGWLSANDVRRLENLNPIEHGDIYLQPLNYIEAGEIPEVPEPVAPAMPEEAPDDTAEDDTEEPTNVIRREALAWRQRNAC